MPLFLNWKLTLCSTRFTPTLMLIPSSLTSTNVLLFTNSLTPSSTSITVMLPLNSSMSLNKEVKKFSPSLRNKRIYVKLFLVLIKELEFKSFWKTESWKEPSLMVSSLPLSWEQVWIAYTEVWFLMNWLTWFSRLSTPILISSATSLNLLSVFKD